VARLGALKGKTYLWERYTVDAKALDARALDTFRPKLLSWAIRRLFVQYQEAHPERTHITPHDLRRRAITLTVKLTGSVDAAGVTLGVSAATAKKYYLDSEKAFDTSALMKRMAGVLLPQNTAPEPAEKKPSESA